MKARIEHYTLGGSSIFSFDQIPSIGDAVYIGFAPAPKVKSVTYIPYEVMNKEDIPVHVIIELE